VSAVLDGTRTNLVNALASCPRMINHETVEQVGYDGDNPVARDARVMYKLKPRDCIILPAEEIGHFNRSPVRSPYL
jgi:hypothetical protein